MPSNRRAFLGAAATLVGFSGCVSPGDTTQSTVSRTPTDETPPPTDTARTDTPTDDTGGTDTNTESQTPELDLREANVMAVSVEPQAGDDYRFDVTLYHDDDGEDGYANWWQVETLDGNRLGRRELAHSHGTRRFTRSATVTASVDCVVVRGHDQTHGYGGRAALVTLPEGTTSFRSQGPEPQSMADESC